MREGGANVANVSVGASTVTSATVATGALDTINQYAPAIGLVLSLTSIIIGIVFFLINNRREKRREKRAHKEFVEALTRDIREQVMSELKEKK